MPELLRSSWIPGVYTPARSEKHNSFVRLVKKKGCEEESMTKVGLDAIGTSTTLESNKSLADSAVNSSSVKRGKRRPRIFPSITQASRRPRPIEGSAGTVMGTGRYWRSAGSR
jgi:hypothetical protein